VKCSFCLLDRDNDGVCGGQAYICRQCIQTAGEAISSGDPNTRSLLKRVSLHAKPILNPIEFVTSLGGLHDFRIDGLAFDTDAQTLTLATSVHFDDPPEYQGETPGVLIFDGVSEVSTDVDGDEGLRISNFDIQATPSGLALEIDLNIGGGPRTGGRKAIEAKFKTLSAFFAGSSDG